MIKEFEMLDAFPTLTEEELLEVNGGLYCLEGCDGSGGYNGIISVIWPVW